jgi:hypothetical protein
MTKRLFQILDELNVQDTANGTSNVGVCNQLVETRHTKHGMNITMGVPAMLNNDILKGKVVPTLLLVNMEEYNKLKGEIS